MKNPYYYFIPNNNYYSYQPNYQTPNYSTNPRYTSPDYQSPNYSNPSYSRPNFKHMDSDVNKNLLRPCIISESYCDYFDLGDKAPDFTLDGIVYGEKTDVSLSDYLGKWVLIFFYGSDFTFV